MEDHNEEQINEQNPEENQPITNTPENTPVEPTENEPAASAPKPRAQEETLEFQSRVDLLELQANIVRIKEQLQRVLVGQTDMVDLLIVSLLAGGHSLIEGVPGVAKTITARLLAKTLNIGFSRIQFTPDLMPSDILGTSIFDMKKSEFEFKKGPIFSNMILIDEINRAPAKTQAALFEVMEERQITIDGNKFPMDPPFMVLATQNPVEQEGTYRLPEAQLDRFLFKIEVGYPTLEDEVEIISREHRLEDKQKIDQIDTIIEAKDIIKLQSIVTKIRVEENILKYIAELVVNTRNNAFLYLGASPRATISILKASKAFAALNARDFVTPEDIKRAAIPVLQHRVIVTPEREMEGITAKQIITQIIENVEIPR
ncbi:MAG: MoxR family ATPase [Flavobacteriaceae bacterium]|nr:MoxR family ATPase [Flavobacteriaceae bacterium]